MFNCKRMAKPVTLAGLIAIPITNRDTQLEKAVQIEWLFDHQVRAELIQRRRRILRDAARQYNHLYAMQSLGCVEHFQEFRRGPGGHVIVQDQNIWPPRFEKHRDNFGCRPGAAIVVPEPIVELGSRERLLKQKEVIQIVFYDEDFTLHPAIDSRRNARKQVSKKRLSVNQKTV